MPVIMPSAVHFFNPTMTVDHNCCLHILQLKLHGLALFTDRKGVFGDLHCFQKFDQWLFGKSDIQVHEDLKTIIKKPLPHVCKGC